MRFVILTQYYPPEIGGSPTRLHSVATELRRSGHEVEVVTGMPNYPRGRFFPGYEWCFYRREFDSDIVVHRVWLYPAVGDGLQRMLNYGSFALTSLVGLLRAKKPDYIFVESPPIFLSFPAFLVGLFWGVPFIFNVADLWPDVIVEGGFLKEGFAVRCMEWVEAWSYRKAAYVNAVTEGLRDALLRKKSVPREKLLFLPNGADTKHFQPRPADVQLKQRLGLENKKVVIWAGTLGYAHGLENVLQAAKLLEDSREIHFLFLGDGSARAGLERLSAQRQLRNVTFRDPVPLADVPPFLSIAEIGLASLIDIPLYEGARPSKILPILASGKPLVFVGTGETAKLVREADAGIVVPNGDPEALARTILELIRDPQSAQAYGRNGRQFVETRLQWSQLVSDWTAQLRPINGPPAVVPDSSRA
jgi:colanic acid biosynthesis glycosyl transferase WcaI